MDRSGIWRWAAGAVIVGALAGFGVVLLPHYRRSAEFERALERVVREAGPEAPEGILRARARSEGARLGLEVRDGHVRVRRTSSGLRLEVRYPVRLELGPYTVTLHFHVRAGG